MKTVLARIVFGLFVICIIEAFIDLLSTCVMNNIRVCGLYLFLFMAVIGLLVWAIWNMD